MFSVDAGAAQISMLNSRTTRSGGNNDVHIDTDPMHYLFPKFPAVGSGLFCFGKSHIEEDFILIAEFSEQEGPRPVVGLLASCVWSHVQM